MPQPAPDNPSYPENASLSNTGEASLGTILNEWSTSRALLASSTQRLLATCSTLGYLCARDVPVGHEEQLVNDALANIGGDILAIRLVEKALDTTRNRLLLAKNKLTPVNKLPLEILGHIFTMSTAPCIHDLKTSNPSHPRAVETVAAVCIHWRNVAFSTTSLWTHIDLSVGFQFQDICQRPATFLERSRGAAIHLHVSDLIRSGYTGYEAQMPNVTKVLAPHMKRVHSLDVNLLAYDPRLLCTVYDCWLNNGVIGSIKALSIRRPGRGPLLSFGSPSHPLSGFGPWEHCDEFLLPLRALRLKNTSFPWDSPAYHGLVDLRLDYTGAISTVSVSQSVFAGILASSPRLETLKLKNLVLTKAPNWDESTSYRLDYLKVLNLHDMPTDSLCLLLPLITPPQNAEGLGVGLPIRRGVDFTEVLKAFFGRSHATTLYLAPDRFSEDVAHIIPFLGHLVSLERLAIRGHDTISGRRLPPIFSNLRSDTSGTTNSYRLSELHLIRYTVSLEKIKPLISIYGVQSLYLSICSFYVERSSVTFEEFQDILLQAFPDIKCIYLPLDLAVKWPCVMMED